MNNCLRDKSGSSEQEKLAVFSRQDSISEPGSLTLFRNVTGGGISDAPAGSFSRGCTDFARCESSTIQDQVQSVTRRLIDDAICSAVVSLNFCVTVADPTLDDSALIAVSQGFEDLTGYEATEVVGRNCRFLNQGCDVEPWQQTRLRECSQNGAPFTTVIQNRKKSGELFLNHLDLRGLIVAQNELTGQELWYLIGIQADVTPMDEEDVFPADHMVEVGRRIRQALTEQFAAIGVSFALESGVFGLISDLRWKPRLEDGCSSLCTVPSFVPSPMQPPGPEPLIPIDAITSESQSTISKPSDMGCFPDDARKVKGFIAPSAVALGTATALCVGAVLTLWTLRKYRSKR